MITIKISLKPLFFSQCYWLLKSEKDGVNFLAHPLLQSVYLVSRPKVQPNAWMSTTGTNARSQALQTFTNSFCSPCTIPPSAAVSSLLTIRVFSWSLLHCSPDLLVNRTLIWAVRWSHIWREKFRGITCKTPLKSVAFLLFKFHKQHN